MLTHLKLLKCKTTIFLQCIHWCVLTLNLFMALFNYDADRNSCEKRIWEGSRPWPSFEDTIRHYPDVTEVNARKNLCKDSRTLGSKQGHPECEANAVPNTLRLLNILFLYTEITYDWSHSLAKWLSNLAFKGTVLNFNKLQLYNSYNFISLLIIRARNVMT